EHKTLSISWSHYRIYELVQGMLRWIEMYSVSSHSKKKPATILPHSQRAKMHICVKKSKTTQQ
ncbi:TPA: hypothetical protein ACM67I_004761, partial [Escherichia coli]